MALDDPALYLEPGIGWADEVTLDGLSVQAIFDVAAEVVQGDVVTTAPAALVLTDDVPASPVGKALIRGGTTYTVRQSLLEPPDGVHTRLILARA